MRLLYGNSPPPPKKKDIKRLPLHMTRLMALRKLHLKDIQFYDHQLIKLIKVITEAHYERDLYGLK